MIELKKIKFHFDSCTQPGYYPGTESKILILSPGLEIQRLTVVWQSSCYVKRNKS
jgi:hypothetical protein